MRVSCARKLDESPAIKRRSRRSRSFHPCRRCYPEETRMLSHPQFTLHVTLSNAVGMDAARIRSGDTIQLGASSVVLTFLGPQDQATTRALLSRISSDTSASELEKLSLFLQAAQSFSNTRVLNDILSTM